MTRTKFALSSLLSIFSVLWTSQGLAYGSGSEEKKDKNYYLKKTGEEVKIGTLSTKRYKHMHFSRKPSKEELKAAKAAGVQVVISMRNPSENEFDEKSFVEGLGMKYYQVPILKNNEIDPLAATELEKIHADTKGQKQLLFCSSGNRAALWFAIHLHVKHQLSARDSVEVASQLGLKQHQLQEKVVEYIEKAGK